MLGVVLVFYFKARGFRKLNGEGGRGGEGGFSENHSCQKIL